MRLTLNERKNGNIFKEGKNGRVSESNRYEPIQRGKTVFCTRIKPRGAVRLLRTIVKRRFCDTFVIYLILKKNRIYTAEQSVLR